MKTRLFFLAIFFCHAALSQTIYKSSIDNGGASVSTPGLSMVYTIGEVNVQEITAGNIHLSEGFIGPYRVPDVTYNKAFVPGWNWFSVNVLGEDMSLGNLLTCVADQDYIKNQTKSATYYDGFGWFGPLQDAGDLDPKSLYKIKTTDPCGVSYTGIPVNPSSTPIDIVQGWNWIGYLPQCILPIDDALVPLNLQDEDYIKNQTEPATYYASFGWFGPLVELTPTDGYMLKKATADVLFYPECPPASSGARKTASAEKAWEETSLNPHHYEYSGSVTATVLLDGVPAGGEDDLVMAYVDDQLRGIMSGMYFEPSQAYAYSLMIYSNLAEGETVTFRYYDAENNGLYQCNETLVFTEDMIVANALEAFELNVDALGLGDQVEAAALSMAVYPNPFNDLLHIEYSIFERSRVRVEVYDMLGKVVEILDEQTLDPGLYNNRWNAQTYPEGTYILKLTTESTSIMKPVILIR